MLSFEGQAKEKPTETVFLLKEFSIMEIDIIMSYWFWNWSQWAALQKVNAITTLGFTSVVVSPNHTELTVNIVNISPGLSWESRTSQSELVSMVPLH